MIAGTLELQMMANVARFTKDMAEVKGVAGAAMKGIESSVASAKAALGALGIGLGVGYFVSMIKGAIDAEDQLGKLAQKTGIAVGELSALKYAADLSDVNIESLSKGIKGLAQRMTEATDSTSKAGQLMRALGVDLSKGASPAIESIANAFAKLPDGTTKASLSVEIFGKAGMDMIPLLNQGAEGIRKMKEEALRLGIVMNDETAKAAEAFNDNLKAVKVSGTGAAQAIFEKLAPSMVRITEAMKEAAMESGVLKAIWVAMGGVAAEVLGLNDSDADKLAKNLRRAQGEVANLSKHIDAVRRQDLLSGVVTAGNMIEGSFLRANAQLRLTQTTLDAIAGKFGDQVSRSQEHGRVLGGGPDTGLENRLRGLLGGAAGDKGRRLREAELIARARVELEEMAAQNVREAWDHWGKIQMADEKARLEGQAQMLKDWLATIDREQDEAIEDGRIMMEGIEDQAKKDAEAAREFGMIMVSAFENAVVSGMKFKDVLHGLAQDIEKMLLRKMITDPLSKAVDDLFKGGSSGGGFSLEGMVSSVKGFFGFASGGIMGPMGPLALHKYADGGIANSPQLAMYGEGSMNEAIVPLPNGRSIPVEMKGGGATVIVHNYGNNTIRAQSRNDGDRVIVEVMVEQVESIMASRIRRGTGLSPHLEQQYGLSRLPGAAR